MEDFLLLLDTRTRSMHSEKEKEENVMMLIDTIRNAFKVLLLNCTSEFKGDTQELNTSTIHLKRAVLFFKSSSNSTLLSSIFDDFPSFVSGILQLLMVKEVEISCSSELVQYEMDCIGKMMHSFVNKRLLLNSDEGVVEENQQRSCLMFMTSLLIFNPFPVPSTRLLTASSAVLVLPAGQEKDLQTIHPFNSMIKLIHTMCMHARQTNFNQLTDDVKQLLHAGLATSVAVLAHLDRCLMSAQGGVNAPVVPADRGGYD